MADTIDADMQKLKEERDSAVAANAMFSQMLEACTANNSATEKQIADLKSEVTALTVAVAAKEGERSKLALELESFVVHADARVAKVEQQLAEAEQQSSAKIRDLQGEVSAVATRYANDVERFNAESTQLRRKLLEASSICAFLPQTVSLKQNEVRQELYETFAATTKELVSARKAHEAVVHQMNNDREVAAAEGARREAVILGLQRDVSNLESARVKRETELLSLAEQAREESSLKSEEISDLKRQLGALQSDASKTAAVHAAQHAAAEQETSALKVRIVELEAQVSRAELQAREAIAAAKSEVAATSLKYEEASVNMKHQLATYFNEVSRAKSDLARSSVEHNTSLKDVRDSMRARLASLEGELATRAQELCSVHDMLTAALKKAEEAAPVGQTINVSGDVPQLEQTISDLRGEIAALQKRCNGAEDSLLRFERQAESRNGELVIERDELKAQLEASRARYSSDVQALSSAHFHAQAALNAKLAQEQRTFAEQLKKHDHILTRALKGGSQGTLDDVPTPKRRKTDSN